MANFRQIHVSIWKDGWFSDLEPDEKLLFIYFFSNENTSLSGIYKVAKKFIAFETGIEEWRVDEILEKFAKAGKVFYEGETVWVVNMRKFHATKSDRVQKRIESDVELISDSQIKRQYIAYQNGNIPYQYPIDSLQQLKEDEDEDEDEEERTTPLLLLSQITGFVSFPSGDADNTMRIFENLIDAHGDNAKNYMQPFYNEWIRRRYRKTNFGWLDWAITGEIPPESNGKQEQEDPLKDYTHA